MPRERRADLQLLADVLADYRFNLGRYLQEYTDLRTLGDDEQAYLAHFCTHGAHEGRILTFDCQFSDVDRLARDPRLGGEIRRYVLRSMIACCLRQSETLLNADSDVLAAVLSWRRFGFQPYLAIGDSHCLAYCLAYSVTRDLLPLRLQCHAGAARGLSNPHARSGYAEKIRACLARIAQSDPPPLRALWCFGQVDVEFVLYYNAIASGAGVTFAQALRFCDETVPPYVDFVRRTTAGPLLRPAIAAIFPPCLADATIHEGYVNASIAAVNSELAADALAAKLRGFEFPDMKTRTAIHRHFNTRLQQECRSRGLPFIDSGAPLIGPDGVVQDRYYFHSGRDHHLSFFSFRKELYRDVESIAPATTAQRIGRSLRKLGGRVRSAFIPKRRRLPRSPHAAD